MNAKCGRALLAGNSLLFEAHQERAEQGEKSLSSEAKRENKIHKVILRFGSSTKESVPDYKMIRGTNPFPMLAFYSSGLCTAANDTY